MTHLPFSPENGDTFICHISVLIEKGRLDLGFEVVHKTLTPQPQSLRIMATNIIHLLNNKCSMGFSADMVDQLCDRGKVAAREDVMVDETRTWLAPQPAPHGPVTTHSSLFEYASCRASGMVMHWKTAIPPSFFNSRLIQAKYVPRNSCPTASNISIETTLS